jgi:hypothetical protein
VKTEVTVTTKTVTDQKKEKKVYSLPGQKHDPPEEVRAAFFLPLYSPVNLFFDFNSKLFCYCLASIFLLEVAAVLRSAPLETSTLQLRLVFSK